MRSLSIVAAMVVVATFAVAAPAQAYWEDCYANPYVPFRNTTNNKLLFSGKVFCNSSNPGYIQMYVEHYREGQMVGWAYSKCYSDPAAPSMSCYSGVSSEPYQSGYWCTVLWVAVGGWLQTRYLQEQKCKDFT